MITTANPYLSRAFDDLAEALDIPPSKYTEAVDRYTAVGKWLDAETSPLRAYRPRVFPQGSFRLGTVVRPVIHGCGADYDIDLVCSLDDIAPATTAQWLKHSIGNRLKDHETYKRMLDTEGRRCWTLNYAEDDGIGFHLDVLPAMPAGADAIAAQTGLGVNITFARHALAITERNAETAYLWVPGGSNPPGLR